MNSTLYYIELQALEARRQRVDTFWFIVGALAVLAAVGAIAFFR